MEQAGNIHDTQVMVLRSRQLDTKNVVREAFGKILEMMVTGSRPDASMARESGDVSEQAAGLEDARARPGAVP